MSGGSSFSTPQTNFLQKQKELREQQQLQTSSSASSAHSPQSQTGQNTTIYSPDKPPIPPRNVPPQVPQRQISVNSEQIVTLRNRPGKEPNNYY